VILTTFHPADVSYFADPSTEVHTDSGLISRKFRIPRRLTDVRFCPRQVQTNAAYSDGCITSSWRRNMAAAAAAVFVKSTAHAFFYRVAQNKMSHRTKCNFSTTDRDFFYKVSIFKGERDQIPQLLINKTILSFTKRQRACVKGRWTLRTCFEINCLTTLDIERYKSLSIVSISSALFLKQWISWNFQLTVENFFRCKSWNFGKKSLSVVEKIHFVQWDIFWATL